MSMADTYMLNFALLLEGLTLDGGYRVATLLPRKPQATGGNFSQCYVVTTLDGKHAFLKALDFHAAFANQNDTMRVIEDITTLFNFERNLLEECAERRMDRVVRAIASGTVRVDSGNPFSVVPYLIFEKADSDIRVQLDESLGDSLSGKLRALHHVATGLKQLHSADIAHQDLKPSNVLVFFVSSLLTVSKVADLGRASRAGNPSPYDDHAWAGDPNYAPPEVLYSFLDPDWSKRRIAADMYMLGGLLSFLFCRTTAVAALFHALPLEFCPSNWNESFEDALPYLQNAFANTIADFASSVPEKLREEIVPIYRQLCNPDPRMRGFPGTQINRNALERYLSSLDLMASRAKSGRYD